MNKHALMLTAATVALLAGPAFAATTITTKQTTAQKTSTTGDLTIDTGGSVVITAASPAVEIDSANSVSLSVVGATISNLNTTNAIGVQLDATTVGTNGTALGTPALDSFGVIDLTGTGTGKIGILVHAPDASGDIFNGDIKLEAGSSTKVQGDSSFGLEVATGATLNGNITILGSLLATATSTTATTASNIVAMGIYGDVTGDIDIGTGGAVQAIGQGANGMVIAGDVTGSLTNSGSLEAVGTTAPKTTGGNPEAGHALIVTGSIGGGFYNAGPSSGSPGTVAASLGIQGTGPTVWIGPGLLGSTSGTGLTIGPYTVDPSLTNFSFVNRGSISAQSHDPNIAEQAVAFVGVSNTNAVNLTGGIFNSGVIAATATSDGKSQSPYSATALSLGDYVNVNGSGTAYGSTAALINSNDSGGGQITASVSGSTGGVATGIFIGQNALLTSIYNSGTIRATATTSDTKITNTLAAYAINDLSGKLSTINNSGTIAATATTLDNGLQKAVAANLSANTGGVVFTNSGTVVGAINFGVGSDTLDVSGPAGGATATVTGDIAFNGGSDILTIGTSGNGAVTGAVTESGSGRVDVTIGGGTGVGTLTLQNTSNSLVADGVTVNDGSTLNISLSNGFNQTADPTNPALITAHNIALTQLSTLNVSFGSFVSTPGSTAAQFTLFDADTSIFIVNPSNIYTTIKQSLPYLFTGTICGYGITGGVFTSDPGCGAGPGNPALVLNLAPKTAGQIGLTGNAANIFDYANAALATDDPLGGNIVTYVTDAPSAQAAYSSFVPDLSGSTRAVAISLTDQATGPVGARQRALRMYASQGGEATLWGQEFVQRLTSGGNADAYRASGFGFTLGADSGDPRSGRYGGAFTFFSGDQTSKGPNFTKTSNEWYMLSGYTDWRGKGLFLDTQLTAGYGSLNGKRHLQLEDSSGNVVLTRTATGKRASLLVAGGISTGVVLTYGGTVITPQFSLDALTMREEGYTETGGGTGTTGQDGFDLRVQPYYANSARGYFGTSFRQDINFGDFFIQPEARIGYRYDFLSDPVKLKAAFASMAGTPNSQFTLTGPDPERGNMVAGGSLAVTTGDWSLGLNYDYIRGNGGAVSQFGTLTLIGRI